MKTSLLLTVLVVKWLVSHCTCGEVSCHLSSAVAGLSHSHHGDVVFLSTPQRAQLTVGVVGGAAGGVA